MSINGINSGLISESGRAFAVHEAHRALLGAYYEKGLLYSGTIEYSGQVLDAATNLSGTQTSVLLSRFKAGEIRVDGLNEEESRDQHIAILFRDIFHDDTGPKESPIILFQDLSASRADPVSALSQIPSAGSSLATEQDVAWALKFATQVEGEFLVHRNVERLKPVRAMLEALPTSKAREEALARIDRMIGAWSLLPTDPFTDIATSALAEFRQSRDIAVLETARTLLQEMVRDNLTSPADIEAAQTAIDQLEDEIKDAPVNDLPS